VAVIHLVKLTTCFGTILLSSNEIQAVLSQTIIYHI